MESLVLGKSEGDAELVAPVTAPQGKAPETPPAGGASATPPPASLTFEQELAALSGDTLNTKEGFTDYLKRTADYDAIKTRANELEDQVSKSFKPANPWVEKLNTLVAGGATFEDINTFTALTSIDVDKMSPLEAISRRIAIEYPGMSPEHIQAHLTQEYGYVPETEDGDGKKVLDESKIPPELAFKLNKEAKEARDMIRDKQAAYDKVEAQQAAKVDEPSAEMQRVQAAAAEASWTPILTAQDISVSFEVEASKEDGRPAYRFDFKPKPEIVQEAREAMLREIKLNPGKYPVSEATRKVIADSMDMYVKLASLGDWQRALFMDVYNSATQMAAQRYAGKLPEGDANKRPAEQPKQDKRRPLEALV